MPQLRPVSVATEPAYPRRWSRSGAGLRRTLAEATVAVALGLGACSPGQPAIEAEGARSSGDVVEAADASPAPSGDAGVGHGDGGASPGRSDASPPEGVMSSSTLGMPLAMGLDDDERQQQAPPRQPPPVVPAAPQMPTAPIVSTPQVYPQKPKPPELGTVPPIRTGGVAPPIRLAGRRGGH